MFSKLAVLASSDYQYPELKVGVARRTMDQARGLGTALLATRSSSVVDTAAISPTIGFAATGCCMVDGLSCLAGQLAGEKSHSAATESVVDLEYSERAREGPYNSKKRQ